VPGTRGNPTRWTGAAIRACSYYFPTRSSPHDLIDMNARERRDNEGFVHAEPYRGRAKPGTTNSSRHAM